MSINASLHAQTTFGVEGGFSDNLLSTNISNRAATTIARVAGMNFDVPFRYRFRNWLYATAAPGVIQKGYSINRTDSLFGEYDRHLNTYFQLPVGVSFVYGRRRWRGTVDPGFFAGYWLAGEVTGRVADIFSASGNAGQSSEQIQLTPYHSSYNFLARRDNRWEFGWQLGLGVQYQLDGRWWISGAGKLFRAWTSTEKTGAAMIPSYNRTLSFSVGVMRSLGKHKSSL